MTSMTSYYHTCLRERNRRRAREVTLQDIDDFFTELPVRQSPEEQTPAVCEEEEKEERPVIFNPKSLFDATCECIGNDFDTLLVCEQFLPRALLPAIRYCPPVEKLMSNISMTVTCLFCSLTKQHVTAPRECSGCIRLAEKARIRALVRSW